MAELEIHHESGHEADPAGKKVGVLAALLAVALAVVTIASHRTHTAAIMHKSSANDAWQHYQSARVKYHSLELGESLVKIFGAKGRRQTKCWQIMPSKRRSTTSRAGISRKKLGKPASLLNR